MASAKDEHPTKTSSTSKDSGSSASASTSTSTTTTATSGAPTPAQTLVGWGMNPVDALDNRIGLRVLDLSTLKLEPSTHASKLSTTASTESSKFDFSLGSLQIKGLSAELSAKYEKSVEHRQGMYTKPGWSLSMDTLALKQHCTLEFKKFVKEKTALQIFREYGCYLVLEDGQLYMASFYSTDKKLDLSGKIKFGDVVDLSSGVHSSHAYAVAFSCPAMADLDLKPDTGLAKFGEKVASDKAPAGQLVAVRFVNLWDLLDDKTKAKELENLATQSMLEARAHVMVSHKCEQEGPRYAESMKNITAVIDEKDHQRVRVFYIEKAKHGQNLFGGFYRVVQLPENHRIGIVGSLNHARDELQAAISPYKHLAVL